MQFIELISPLIDPAFGDDKEAAQLMDGILFALAKQRIWELTLSCKLCRLFIFSRNRTSIISRLGSHTTTYHLVQALQLRGSFRWQENG
jgi:hypothetical protein